MKHMLRIALLSTTCALLPMGASAQTSLIDLLPIPNIGSIPSGSEDANESHDPIAIGELMKIVELARTIGGGITNLYQVIVEQKVALEKMREAQTGKKEIPQLDDIDGTEERQGGEGLNEMTEDALNGTASAPVTVQEALDKFRTTFGLDKAFAQKDDDSLSRVFTAHATAKGAIVSSTGEAGYKSANASMERLGSYIGAVRSSPDLKTSVDLNTRIMIELTQQVNESLRTQSAIASMAGTYFMLVGAEQGRDDSFLSGLKNFNR
jgi:hypothetical protein